jgi:predicted alpha/beta hydrolase family esterase
MESAPPLEARRVTAPTLVVVPGLGNSGPQHWQSLWEARHPGARRVEQADWDRPALGAWVAALDATVRAAGGPVALAAHSLACALVAHWAAAHDTGPVRGALLVSPSDVDSPAHTPDEVRCFAPMPMARLPFPALVVASEDDPYVAPARARAFAAAWGAGFASVGRAGHVNAASGLGDWPAGQALLARVLGG